MAIMDRPAKRTKLLSDDSSSAASDEEEVTVPTNGFRVNQEYAKRFEHNKKREEMHRLEEKFKQPGGSKMAGDEEDDEDSEEDESEDDEGELATLDVDNEIFAALDAIKSRDPRVYDQDAKFYREFEVEEGKTSAQVKPEKPMYLQDYHRQNLLAGYTGEEPMEHDAAPRTYNQEQDEIRRGLVNSMHATGAGSAADLEEEDSDEGDFLVTKSKTKVESAPAASKKRQITDQDVAAADKDPENYLSNFMAARAWVPNETSRWKAFDSDDSDEEKRADEYEEAYNMRFEDPDKANEKLQSFSRDVGKYGVRRDETTGRKRAREREREQRELAKREREEERARLKKLKVEEAEERIKKIKDAGGLRGKELDVHAWRDVLEGDFDDELWEVEMRRRFGDKYYAENDIGADEDGDDEENAGEKRKLHKPKWDDEIDIKDLVPDFEKDDGKPAFTLSSDDEGGEKQKHDSALPAEASDGDDDVTEARDARKKRKTKKDRTKELAEAKRTARRERRQIEALVDSSLPLAHPTLSSNNSKAPVAGFRYRDTSPVSFGLSTRDILFADDSQLNQYAGLKKMAAFRDEDKKRRDKKRYSKKGRLREWRKETFGSVDGPKERLDRSVFGEARDQDEQKTESNVVEGARKRKRKNKAKAVAG